MSRMAEHVMEHDTSRDAEDCAHFHQMEKSMETPKVYAAIAKVMADIGRDGITKSRKNTQQGYNFRGIDDVFNALSTPLSRAGLVILPRVLKREVTEKTTKSGGALFYVVLDVEFDFVAAEDGSKHTAAVVGEAMDSADKATNKAMSAAYKYVCMQTFCIPTEGDNDADGTTHEVAARPVEQRPTTVDPRGEGHKSVDPQLVEKWVSRAADVVNQDKLENEIAPDVLKVHDELNTLGEDVYIAVADQLASRKIIGKDGWRKFIVMARTQNAQMRMAANGRA